MAVNRIQTEHEIYVSCKRDKEKIQIKVGEKKNISRHDTHSHRVFSLFYGRHGLRLT
jgi:hypothetical protein